MLMGDYVMSQAFDANSVTRKLVDAEICKDDPESSPVKAKILSSRRGTDNASLDEDELKSTESSNTLDTTPSESISDTPDDESSSIIRMDALIFFQLCNSTRASLRDTCIYIFTLCEFGKERADNHARDFNWQVDDPATVERIVEQLRAFQHGRSSGQ
jgi:hypothetical protein